MIRPILFASVASVLVGGAVQAQQGGPRNPQNWKGARSSLPNAVFRARAEEQRDKGTHAREAELRAIFGRAGSPAMLSLEGNDDKRLGRLGSPPDDVSFLANP